MMRKFTQRVLILGAAEMAIIGAVGGVNLVGEAQADPTTCVNAAGLCQPAQLTGPHTRVAVVCQPAGPKAGVRCSRVVPHNA
jgi:hypothetical protein